MKAIIKYPGEDPRQWNVPNTLEGLQAVVGGYIEVVRLFEDMAVICDEEGRLKGLPYNCEVCGVDFVGTILFVGTNEDEFKDIPVEDLDMFQYLFPDLWEGNT